jgi:hypothetical protein
MAVQEICPVSGQRLGAHGDPIKVQIGQETMFLCCKGCLQGKVEAKHWATIHANFAKAQRICPVMKHELPPCIKKIEADAKTYLQKLDELYAASLRPRQAPQ